MWPYYPELLATPVPRYTSYPTAAEFGPDVGPAELTDALRTAAADVSLYIHIPFCETICWYCGCNTSRTNRKDRLATYLDALHREIALVAAQLPPTARVTRIAFGGGSPNALAPTDFVRLMLALTHFFGVDNPDISVEIDPRGLTTAWGAALAGVGVKRASLGVQTFAPRLQTAIGRVQSAQVIADCTRLLRDAGVTSLNYDLMYGLPGQDLGDLGASIAQATALGADRIALFGYAHVPQAMPRQRRIDASVLPDQHLRFAMAARGHDQLLAAGYIAVGFDHFALPGDPLAQATISGRLRRNFQGFSDDTAGVVIGLGASAISTFPHLLAQNEKNAGRYRMILSQDRLAPVRGVRRSPDDAVRGEIIERLLCRGRAPISDKALREAAAKLEPFVKLGLTHVAEGTLIIAPDGLPYARSIAAIFDRHRTAGGRTFSSAV